MRFFRRLILTLGAVFCLLLLPSGLSGQDEQQQEQTQKEEEEKDKYVRLMSAKSVSLLEIDGKNYRKAEGPARFLHNDTWLICDTAWWNVDEQLITAIGNVSIEQEQTELKSDRMIYHVDSSLAEFHGVLVQLSDKDGNTLRTSDLDYNTRDSVAVFNGGGSLRDKDGQIIESDQGTYDAKASLFTFHNRVNMYTDSAFVKTPDLWYNSKTSMVTFPDSVDVWRDEYLLSGHRGWYDRGRDIFFFCDAVHGLSKDKEMWSDSLFYFRTSNDFDMLGNVQLVDSTRRMTALSGHIHHIDSLDYVTMSRDPVIMTEVSEKTKSGTRKDTVYVSADTMTYYLVKRCDLDSLEVVDAHRRLEDAAEDPVLNIRIKAKEEADKKIKEAIEADPNVSPELKKKYAYLFPSDSVQKANQGDVDDDEMADVGVDSLVRQDSLMRADSLMAGDSLALSDSLAKADPIVVKDTTKLGFIIAVNNVKMLRDNMQAVCDSLRYGDIDSMARMYRNPIIWNEKGRHQYTADSVYISVAGGGLDKAFLLSSAFILVKEGTKYYDQVRSTEMTAYFDSDNQLRRFDALGGVTAMFYLQEDNTFTSVNRSEATMMSVNFLKGELQGLTYYESPKSDVYPVPQMTAANSCLKGFILHDDKRPDEAADLSWRTPCKSQREEYENHEKARFPLTKRYFPGYMAGVYRAIAVRDSLNAAAASKPSSTPAPADTTALADTSSSAASIEGAIASSASIEGAIASAAAAHEALEKAEPDAPDALPDSLQAMIDSVSVELDSLLRMDIDTLDDIMLYIPDSIRFAPEPELTPAQKRAAEARAKREARMKEREAKREARLKKRDAKWAELDAKEARKNAEKKAAKQARKDKRAQQQMARLKEQKLEEDRLREKYKEDALKKLRQ